MYQFWFWFALFRISLHLHKHGSTEYDFSVHKFLYFQVVLSATLKSKKTGQEVVFATTHLKARNGTLMPTLRNEQGKDLMEYLNVQAQGRPLVVTGDFNAEPGEPVYQTMTNNKSRK